MKKLNESLQKKNLEVSLQNKNLKNQLEVIKNENSKLHDQIETLQVNRDNDYDM